MKYSACVGVVYRVDWQRGAAAAHFVAMEFEKRFGFCAEQQKEDAAKGRF